MTLSVILLITVFGYLMWDKVPVTALLREVAGADWRWLLAAAAVIVVNRVVMALKWWLVLRGEGLRIGPFYLIMVTFVGYFAGYLVPGGVGLELIRVWYLSRDHRLGSIGLASAIIDRTTGLAALASVALLALLVFETPIPAREWIMGACIAVLVGFTLMILVAPTVSSWLSTIVPITDERPLGKWRAISRETALAISNMHGRSGVMLNALLVGVAVQLLRGVGIYLIFVSLGQPHLLGESVMVAPLLMLVTMVPLGAGTIALGAGAMVLLLEPLGVPPAISLSASLLSEVLLLVLIPIGALCFVAAGTWRRESVSVIREADCRPARPTRH